MFVVCFSGYLWYEKRQGLSNDVENPLPPRLRSTLRQLEACVQKFIILLKETLFFCCRGQLNRHCLVMFYL